MLFVSRLCGLFSSAKLRDYYRILGVASSASDKQIKAQFHRLAKQYHPDSGKHKDQKKFKELLEAYKYLSDPANPRTESSSSTSSSSQQQQQSTTHEEQEAYRKETRQQRIRRETYEYFNRTRRPREQKEESNSGYDSFLETIKAAPELILMTVFVGVVIAQWIWMMPKQPRPYSVEERVFQTRQDEEEYYRRQLMKESQRAHMFDWKSKFDGHRPKDH